MNRPTLSPRQLSTVRAVMRAAERRAGQGLDAVDLMDDVGEWWTGLPERTLRRLVPLVHHVMQGGARPMETTE